jgi:hypothetical protein
MNWRDSHDGFVDCCVDTDVVASMRNYKDDLGCLTKRFRQGLYAKSPSNFAPSLGAQRTKNRDVAIVEKWGSYERLGAQMGVGRDARGSSLAAFMAFPVSLPASSKILIQMHFPSTCGWMYDSFCFFALCILSLCLVIWFLPSRGWLDCHNTKQRRILPYLCTIPM